MQAEITTEDLRTKIDKPGISPDLKQSLDEFLESLPRYMVESWDDEGAKPVQMETANLMINLLRYMHVWLKKQTGREMPGNIDIGPTSKGSIDANWSNGNSFDLIINIKEDGTMCYYGKYNDIEINDGPLYVSEIDEDEISKENFLKLFTGFLCPVQKTDK